MRDYIPENILRPCTVCSKRCTDTYVVFKSKILCLNCYTAKHVAVTTGHNTTPAFKDKQRKADRYSKQNRRKKTPSELKFESILKKTGIKYTAQRAFIAGDAFYICDYVLERPYSIAFEIDGEYHESNHQRLKDDKKDEYLRSRKFNVVRISNKRVETLTVSELMAIIKKNYRSGGLQKHETDRY